MRNCFQYPLEVHSKTSNDQALLNPFYHYIKMKAYMRVGVGDTLPRGRLSPPPIPPPHHSQILTMFIETREIFFRSYDPLKIGAF